MKKRIQKLNLSRLDIQSFVTEPNTIRGGDFIDSPLCGPETEILPCEEGSYTGPCCW